MTILWIVVSPSLGCTRYRDDLDYNHPVEYSWTEPEIATEFTLFQGVAWDAAISQSMQPVIKDQSLVENRSVLNLFSGPGVIAVMCGLEDAKSVLSLAESDVAAACTKYNVVAHDQDAIVTVQCVDWSATSVVAPTDRFELILATLAAANESNTDTIDRRIEILQDCAAANLDLSGRVIAVCENEAIAEKLKSACEQAGNILEPLVVQPSLRPIFEIKRSAVLKSP